ncbi:hypothetical protein Bca101_047429 [Brassica carinata]
MLRGPGNIDYDSAGTRDYLSHAQLSMNTPVFFQFRGGDWRSGGTCHIETPPDFGASLVPSGHGNIQEKFKDG